MMDSMFKQLGATSVPAERRIVTWSLENLMISSVSKKKLMQEHKTDSGEKDFFFLFYKTRQQAEAIRLSCNAKGKGGKEGREQRGREMEEDFKLTPLWIFPYTV